MTRVPNGVLGRLLAALADDVGSQAEAGWKFQRLRETVASGRPPDVLLIGASVLDADIRPDIVMATRPELGRVLNGCLAGADLRTFPLWWSLVRDLVRPGLVVMESHPLMTLSEPGRRHSTMAAKLNAELVRLRSVPRPSPHVPASVQVIHYAATRPPIGEIRRRMSRRRIPTPSAGHDEFGWLSRFADLSREEGLSVMPPDWYEAVRIDPYAPIDVEAYLDVAEGVRADVDELVVAISPLALDSHASTLAGHHQYIEAGDQLLDAAPRRGIHVVDLRPLVDHSDFVDPFHLKRGAVERVSGLLANALADRP